LLLKNSLTLKCLEQILLYISLIYVGLFIVLCRHIQSYIMKWDLLNVWNEICSIYGMHGIYGMYGMYGIYGMKVYRSFRFPKVAVISIYTDTWAAQLCFLDELQTCCRGISTLLGSIKNTIESTAFLRMPQIGTPYALGVLPNSDSRLRVKTARPSLKSSLNQLQPIKYKSSYSLITGVTWLLALSALLEFISSVRSSFRVGVFFTLSLCGPPITNYIVRSWMAEENGFEYKFDNFLINNKIRPNTFVKHYYHHERLTSRECNP